MGQPLNSEIERFLQSLNDVDHGGETDQDEMETVDVYFVRREAEIEPQDAIVDATPAQPTCGPSALFTSATIFFCVGILFSAIALQLYLAVNPPVATITIVPDTKTVTLNGTLPLGRLTHAITLYQTQSVQTTGRGHQAARSATGTLTLYNTAFDPQVVSAGSVFQGNDGIEVATLETISVPANNPPQDGIASVAAHASTPGSHGNIQALDINGVASSSLFVKNLEPFTGGQDERSFQTVNKSDIDKAVSPMKSTLTQGMRGALQGQLKPNEQLYMLPCAPMITSDHQPGDEATKVTVTVSETCSAVAYDNGQLQREAMRLMTSQAMRTVGTGYSEVGNLQVTVNQATLRGTTPTLVFSSLSTWVYALSGKEQERLKTQIAGRTQQEATRILSTLPGIKHVALQWDENTKLPKDPQHIKFLVLVDMSGRERRMAILKSI